MTGDQHRIKKLERQLKEERDLGEKLLEKLDKQYYIIKEREASIKRLDRKLSYVSKLLKEEMSWKS